MKKNWNAMVIALVLVVAISCGVAVATGVAGSKEDPLVTLSYLNEIFAPTLESEVDKAVSDNETALKKELDSAIDSWTTDIEKQMAASGSGNSTTFEVITLSSGQTLTGRIGCEIMLRVGSATCVADGSPGLIDSTDGTTLSRGSALKTNHLYLVTIDTRGVTATSSTVKVLVRGEYTVA